MKELVMIGVPYRIYEVKVRRFPGGPGVRQEIFRVLAVGPTAAYKAVEDACRRELDNTDLISCESSCDIDLIGDMT